MKWTTITAVIRSRIARAVFLILTLGLVGAGVLALLAPNRPDGATLQLLREAEPATDITVVDLKDATVIGLNDAKAAEQVDETNVGASSKELPARAEAPCTLFVAPDGSDENDGAQAVRSLRTPTAAVNRSKPGDVVCFAPGVYTSQSGNQGALHIADKQGAAGQPITFRSTDRRNPAVFTMGSVETGRGVSVVFIQRSSYITIDGLEITDGFRGVTGNGASQIRILNSKIHRTGGEVVSFSRRVGRVQPEATTNPVSSFIEIAGNEIAHSGLANGDPFGEGIYLGTSEPSFRDDSNHILVADNYIHDLVDEAIDVKTGVWGVSITNNRIEAVDVNSQGAVTVSVLGQSWEDGEYIISGNTISDVTSRQWDGVGIWVGHGNAVVENNVIWNVADSGIYVPNTFNMGDAREVVIRNNTIWDSGQQSIDLGDDWYNVRSAPPVVRLDETNQTWDGARESAKIGSCNLCIPNEVGLAASG